MDPNATIDSQTATTEEDEFTKAFSDAAAEATATTEPVVEEPTPPKVEETTEHVSEEPTAPKVEETTEPVSEEPTAPKVEETTEPVSEEPTASKVEKTTEPVSKEPTAPKVEETPALEAPEIKDYELSEEQKKVIAAFESDWSDHAAYTKIIQEQQAHNLEARLTRTLASVVQKFYQDLAPVIQSHVKSEAKGHFETIRAAHQDYDEVVHLLPKWIESQPKYLRPALKSVYDSGSTSDVIDMVAQFKQATGRVTPQEGNPPPVVRPAPKVDAAKVAALAPVSSRRTAVETKGVDANDFDSGWQEALAEV